MIDGHPPWPRRRHFLTTGGAALLAASMPARSATAQIMPAEVSPHFTTARIALLAGRQAQVGRVTLDIPRLAESGNSVSLKVAVASPMSAADHVTAVHILSEQNPIAVIGKFRFGPRSGRAEISTNIRLATTQNVHAIAEMSDGSVWAASSEVVVLIAACLDGA